MTPPVRRRSEGEPAVDESSESQESSSVDSSSEEQQQAKKKAKTSHTSARRRNHCPHGRQRSQYMCSCGGPTFVLMDGGEINARSAEGSVSAFGISLALFGILLS